MGAPVEMDDSELDLGGVLQQKDAQVLVAEDPRGGDRDLRGAFPGILQQVFEALIGAFRFHIKADRVDHLVDDGDEVFEGEGGFPLGVQIWCSERGCPRSRSSTRRLLPGQIRPS